jgi:hypothetical protein
MTRSAFTPQPLLSTKPFLRPASLKLPEPHTFAPLMRHKTLPYGVPVISMSPAQGSSLVQIREERQGAFMAPVAVDSGFTETQQLAAIQLTDPELTEDHLRIFIMRMQRFLPLGIAASVGFLLACFL